MSLPNLVGQVLGQYEILELLGIGGMGAVYRAQQLRLKRPVALKVLSPVLANQPGYIERFIREAETAAALEHNHIVPIYDFGTDQDWPFIVMRLLTGGTLADRLQYSLEHGQTLPSLMEISALLSQLSGALDYAHSVGVIHRDVKPSNIMFDDRGNAYIVDFGIAKLLEGSAGLTGSGMSMGTPAYMPPEQWRNESLTPAADQYALGIIAYQLLTGAAPFHATTPYGYMHQHLHEMPPPPHTLDATVPVEIGAVLERAIAKHPGARFHSATAFSDTFEASLSEAPEAHTDFFTKKIPKRRAVGSFGSSGARHPSAPNPRTARRWLWALAVGAAALAVVTGLLLLQPERDAPSGGRGVSPNSPQPTTILSVETAGGETPVVMVATLVESTATQPILVIVVNTETPMPRPIPSMTPMPTATETPSATRTTAATPSPLPTNSAIPTEAPPSTITATSTASAMASLSATWTELPTFTASVSVSPTATDTPTASRSPAPPSVTPTQSPSPTRQSMATPTTTLTPVPTSTSVPTNTRTSTPSPSATSTQTPTTRPSPTVTHTSTATLTLTPMLTATPIPTSTTTSTPILLRTLPRTPTTSPSKTPMATPRPIPTVRSVNTVTPTPTPCQLADVNGDGEVDILDIRSIAASYGRAAADDDSLSSLDFNSSGAIDILDVRRVASQYGSVCQ